MPDSAVVDAVQDTLFVRVESAFRESRPALVLFGGVTGEGHDPFLARLADAVTPSDLLLLWHGERVDSKERFYDECVRVMPGVRSYFGHNLDALDEVLRDPYQGLARDPNGRTYWIWRNAHVLFAQDIDFFRRAFAALVQDAVDVTTGRGLGSNGFGPQPSQPVHLLLTGLWEVMGEAAQDSESFLHLTRWWQYRPPPPPEPTRLIVFRVTQ